MDRRIAAVLIVGTMLVGVPALAGRGAGQSSGAVGAAAVAPDSVIATYSGTGSSATRPFTANGPWEAQWTTTGYLGMDLMSPDGEMIENLANQEAGSGSHYSPTAGTYYLAISGSDDWTVRIVAVGR